MHRSPAEHGLASSVMRTTHPAMLRSFRHDVADRPFLVIWECTRACPLACRHCRAEAKPHRDNGELDTAEAMRLMSQVADFGRPPPLFVITGGDPFQRDDLYALVRHGTDVGLPVAVSPSGTPTLTREALARLHDAGARAISLSIDAAAEADHDRFRGVSGVYGWTMQAWRTARDLGLKVQINTTVTKATVAALPEIARLVHDRGVQLWSVFLLVPTGRGHDLSALTAEETEDALNALYDVGRSVPVKTTEGHHFRRVCLQRAVIEERGADHQATLGLGPLYQRLRSELASGGLVDRQTRVRRPPMQVSAARGFVFISHTGAVQPTGFLPIAAGNVRDTPLPEIYRESTLFTGLRDATRLGGRCGRCEFRQICGGSRARAFAVTGDPFAEDPACSYQPGTFPFADDVADLRFRRPPAAEG